MGGWCAGGKRVCRCAWEGEIARAKVTAGAKAKAKAKAKANTGVLPALKMRACFGAQDEDVFWCGEED
jgi:hypothetical protein